MNLEEEVPDSGVSRLSKKSRILSNLSRTGENKVLLVKELVDLAVVPQCLVEDPVKVSGLFA